MARKPIDIGTIGNDGTGDSIRDAFRKVNDNFRELYSSLGLGERLRFRGLDDTPDSYLGQENALLTVNTTEEGISFRKLEAGSGIQIDFDTNQNAIILNNELSNIAGDTAPNLGGALNTQFGIFRFPIGNLPDLSDITETQLAKSAMQNTHGNDAALASRLAVNKGYADGKISLAGVDGIDPATGINDASFGTMTGPLVLARDPEPEDDERYNGRVAATKRYVDGAGFGSAVNLYVATSGQDDRPNIARELQGRALSFAYRTIESALKRAEELVLEAPIDIGPYKKVLTYDNGRGKSTLKYIDAVENSGSGFSGQLTMSVESLTVVNGGTLYRPGDVLTLNGGTFVQASSIEVLSVNVLPGTGGRGAISTFRILTTGIYTALPGSTNLNTTTNSEFGSGAVLDTTYYVNSVSVLQGGSNYGLVSVRFLGGGGRGAFGEANISGGVVTGITISSRGTGFTNIPNILLDLPRFYLETEGFRTDFTGDLSDDPNALRTRDLREGLLLRGETSGALAQILGHSGQLSTLDEDQSSGRPDLRTSEMFEVDLLSGEFEIGEVISFGDVTKNIQICVFVEAGIYEENLPLRVPRNVAVIGDEFRRTIIKPRGVISAVPRSAMSTSPWAGIYFRRDRVFDKMNVATQEFGRHYLTDSTLPIYPMINNPGLRRASANLIDFNRDFIKTQVIGWINYQVTLATFGNSTIDPDNTSIWYQLSYNQELCRRDVGLIVDSMVFDIRYGGYSRSVSAALKYFQNVSSLIAITTQKSVTLEAIQRINVLAQDIINNTVINTLYTQNGDEFSLDDAENTLTPLFPQVVDQAFVSESGSDTVIAALTAVIVNILTDDPATRQINWPKNNDQMDVFLCNDANIVRAVTCQGQGGFMLVLDPEGQILTKSPYCQESAAFSRSTGLKTFAGGMFVDGFTGNQEFRIRNVPTSNTLEVDGLMRIPNTPCSFLVNDVIYRINYIRNYNYAIDYPTSISQGTSQWYSTAQLVLDETTPWTFGVFTYQDDVCRRDVGLILDGLGYDLVFQTNYHQRKAGFTYRQVNAKVVLENQLRITLKSIAYTHEEVNKTLLQITPGTPESILDEVTASNTSIAQILKDGINFAPTLVLTDPTGVSANISNAKNLLLANIEFIKAETIGWINAQIAGNISPFTSGFVFDSARCARDVGFLVEALAYDLLYGGNSQTRDAALKYYDGVGDAVTLQLAAGQEDETAAAISRTREVCQAVILNTSPVATFSSVARITGAPATSTESTAVNSLLSAVAAVVTGGVAAAPAQVLPPTSGYGAARLTAKSTIDSAKSQLQDEAIFFVNLYGNTYEILMPGNRSMLSNDFTQVADLGYGLVVANGGLTEAVSMFTYYCQISYYAVTGGQIRSIGGSSSHGNYALVAEGSDPLEVPRPVALYHQLSQGAYVVANTVATANKAGSVVLFVNFDDYLPLNGSELEVNHSNQFVRYPISSVNLVDSVGKIAKLSIGAATGLDAGIPHGQQVVIRQNAFVVLTGDVVDVATRPSTALLLRDSDFVYRVLEFNDYDEEYDVDDFIITDINTTTGVFTTNVPHRQTVGRQVKIKRETGDTLPSAISARKDTTPATTGTVYYINSVPTPTTFTISITPSGTALDLSAGPSYSGTLSARLKPFGLALTQLRENYQYTVSDLVSQPFRNPDNLLQAQFTAADPTVVTNIVVGSGNGSTGGTLLAHNLTAGSQLKFSSTGGAMPGGLFESEYFWVVSKDLSADSFKLSRTPPIYSINIGVNSNLDGITISGLSSTSGMLPGMRLMPKPSISITSITGNGTTTTVTFAQQLRAPYLKGQTVTVSGVINAGFNGNQEVLACTTTSLTFANSTNATSSGGTISVIATGNLGTNPRILTIVNATSITIANDSGSSNGSVVFDVEGEEISANTTGSNIRYGLLTGDQNQSTIAVADLPLTEENRVIGSVMMYEGEQYIVTAYQEKPNGVTYSVITLDRPLDVSAISFLNPIALRSGVPVPSLESVGTLTIRIALVRVTSHDFLEIGTGSYADTNYPNDIFGPPVNDFAGVPLYTTEFSEEGAPISRSQVQERGVGRSFFVTTDQFGNFSVGPYFKVDQGTGTVTFAASIALSQLDGLGFKRGATISEFSVDDSLDGAANDAVPTEGAVRGYIDRRLGISHEGVPVLEGNLIPSGVSGGFMPLTGLLAMRGDMDLGTNKIINLKAPFLDSDAARLDSINYSNLKDTDGTPLLSFTNVSRGQLTVMSGDVNNVVNVTPTGDVTFTMTAGNLSAGIIQTAISPGVIVDADINSSANIAQSKLSMTAANARSSATGITQADRGLSSFDSSQFNVTNGWVSVKDNGILLSKLEQISARHVLGNPSATSVSGISTISYVTVVNEGGAIKKTQFQSGAGYLKRSNSTTGSFTSDDHFTVVDDNSNKSSSTLVRRDANGDFAGRDITADNFRLQTTSTGTFAALRSNQQSETNGFTELMGYGGGGGSAFAGLQVGAGGTGANNKTNYNNTVHEFRSQNGAVSFGIIDVNGMDLGARRLAVAAITSVTSISTGSQTTAGTITGRWTLTGDPTTTGSRFQATYAADLAEYYEGDQEYEVGTVLVFGGEKEVTVSDRVADARVAGVVSNTAAYTMYGACPGFKNLIALQGRVPCRVVGKIEKGDILVSSDVQGVAMAAKGDVRSGTMVGKAIEAYDSDKVGTIQVAVGRT